MISDAQIRFYWVLWGKLKRRMMNGRETWTQEEEARRRHEFHVQVFGRDISHRDFTFLQLSTFKRAALNFLSTGGIDAELAEEKEAYKRTSWSLNNLMRELGVDRNYVQGVIDHMDMHGRFDSGPDRSPEYQEMTTAERDVLEWERELTRDARPRKLLDTLNSKQLTKVIIALKKQRGRVAKAGRQYVLKDV